MEHWLRCLLDTDTGQSVSPYGTRLRRLDGRRDAGPTSERALAILLLINSMRIRRTGSRLLLGRHGGADWQIHLLLLERRNRRCRFGWDVTAQRTTTASKRTQWVIFNSLEPRGLCDEAAGGEPGAACV